MARSSDRAPGSPDLVVLQDLGERLDVVSFAAGKEIARVTIDPKAYLNFGLNCVNAGAARLFREG